MRISLSLLCLGLLALCLPAQQTDKARRTRTIKLTERAGLARTKTPVELTVRFEKSAFKNASDVRLFSVADGKKTPVPVQVLETTTRDGTDSFAPAAQTFVRIFFLADVPANGSASYEVALEGAKPAKPIEGLTVTGKGVGRSIDTGKAAFDLHGPSGQLLALKPTEVNKDRLIFQQDSKRPELPVHWNPDVWKTGERWSHTSTWNDAVAFNPEKHKSAEPPAGTEKNHPFYYREISGGGLYRLTRWGKMPYIAQAEASVTYTFHAGTPVVMVESLVEFRESMSVHAVRNSELVFSRHQLDTAVWITKDGKFHKAVCYDYKEKDRSFKEIAKLPGDVPCLGFANEVKGYGVAMVNLSMTNLSRRDGIAGDEQAHFYVRDYDEHGKGSPANFLYFVRPVVYRDGYFPTDLRAGSLYSEKSAVVLFRLNKEADKKYDELLRWQKLLTNPLEIGAD
jgi:hypothetical protein